MTLLQAKIDNHWRDGQTGFTLVEVCVAMAVCVVFGLAAFETNARLLIALKAQKETTAASMMLQERMEQFRTTAYSNIADYNHVQTNMVQKPTVSEPPLGGLSETITVSGYLSTAGAAGYPTDGSTPNQWVRNSQYPSGNQISLYSASTTALAANYNLIQVDILLSWTSANSRTRTRDLTAVFGKGNIGQ